MKYLGSGCYAKTTEKNLTTENTEITEKRDKLRIRSLRTRGSKDKRKYEKKIKKIVKYGLMDG